MIARHAFLFTLSFAPIALFAQPAAAQSAAKAASVAAFDDAERLMSEGQIAEACAKYAESQRLDAQLGTLLHLADCFEKNGQVASAWATFREASELAAQRQDPRQQAADERVQALAPRLSKLQINVAPSLDRSNLHVERDEVVVGAALWGTPTPTDPGPHVVTVSAPGRRTWKTTAVVPADGSTTVIDVPELEREGSASAPGSATSAAAPSNVAADTDAEREPSPPRWTALTAGAVGLIGVGIGAVFGLSSKSKRDEAEQYCTGNTCVDQRGVDLADDALAAGNVSTVAFIIGGVGLAAGATLWIVGTPRSRTGSAEPAARVGVFASKLVVEQSF